MSTVIHIKANREVKENAQNLAKELGLSLSDVVNSALRNFIRTREVYISAVPQMTPELERLLGTVEKDLKMGANVSANLSSASEVDKYLNSL
ncbi:MAG: hypothetical protein WEC39_00095 [Patescibacteria group bacterium]